MAELHNINQQLREFPGNRYYRLYLDRGNHDLSDNSKLLHSITGYFADEYILPPTKFENIFNLISDESTYKSHSCVSTVLIPIYNKNHDNEKYDNALAALCQEYGIKQIHFTEIFGQNILGKLRRSFLQKYVDIVSDKEMWAISFSADKATFLSQLSLSDMSDSTVVF